mmetsp:Transcript_26023/g.56764  ORF Transcript_26023/g.56764 Transcript_26023/m.56764 type:complete len:270 (-) Transcript_26023:652-1461(-)
MTALASHILRLDSSNGLSLLVDAQFRSGSTRLIKSCTASLNQLTESFFQVALRGSGWTHHTSSQLASCLTGLSRPTTRVMFSLSTALAWASNCCTCWPPTSAVTTCWWTLTRCPMPPPWTLWVMPPRPAACTGSCRPLSSPSCQTPTTTSLWRTTCTACPPPCTRSTRCWPTGTPSPPPPRTAMAPCTPAPWRARNILSRAPSGTPRSPPLSLALRRCLTPWTPSRCRSTWPMSSWTLPATPAIPPSPTSRSWTCSSTAPPRSSPPAMR